MRTGFLLALPFLLTACDGGLGPGEDAITAVDPEGTERPRTNPLIERFDDVKIVVDANGLGAYQGEPLRFGTPRDTVDTMAAKAFGEEGETSRNEECGAGPMEISNYGPLQIAYQDGRFAGWFLRAGQGVVTSDGIRPGVSTLESLEAERQVRELDTTLEGDFEYTTADFGTIRGFADEGRITALQAGVSCFFR